MDHLAWATVEAGIHDEDVKLVFVSHEEDPTNPILRTTADLYGFQSLFVTDEQPPTVEPRSWEPARLRTMVRVRNALLGAVRELEPDLFLSLDTDILLHPKALRKMIRLLEVAGKQHARPSATSHCVWLDETGTKYPNFAMLTPRGQLRREATTGDVMGVHVLMAAKLMTPRAYAVDYEYDSRGEDIGWSLAVRQQGMRLAWTGSVTSKHCYLPEHIDRVDRRCGY